MKIILSVMYLKNCIGIALKNNYNQFSLCDNVLKFEGDKTFSLLFTHVVGQENRTYTGIFIQGQWNRMYDFLEYLEDQPIVVDFKDYYTEVHELPEIEFIQFRKRF